MTMLQGKKKCRKCQDIIPNRVKINGVSKSLQRRHFCLKCSPYGSHNTIPDDPSRPRALSTVEMREDAKIAWRITAARALQRAHELRVELIDMCGGCCSRCGYSKYTGALEFHHLNKETKLFSLSAGNLRSKKKDLILAELAKCILLCSNCHREIEDESRISSVIVTHQE